MSSFVDTLLAISIFSADEHGVPTLLLSMPQHTQYLRLAKCLHLQPEYMLAAVRQNSPPVTEKPLRPAALLDSKHLANVIVRSDFHVTL